MERGLPVLRELDPEELSEVQRVLGCMGGRTLQAFYGSTIVTFRNVKMERIPDKYLQMVDADE